MGIRNVIVTVSGGNLIQPISAATGSFGYFNISGLVTGHAYVVAISARHILSPSPYGS